MTIPLSYNLRNLVVRKTTTLMTALGIAWLRRKPAIGAIASYS